MGESSAEPTSERQCGAVETDTGDPHSEQKALWESADSCGAEEARGSMWEEPCGKDHERALDMGRREEKDQTDHGFTA